MKLRKEEFEEVLMEAAHHTANIRGGRCVEIHDAFIHNNLEIEGYEKSEWIKYDMRDPKTFPPVDKYLLLAQNERILGVYVPFPEWIVVDWRCVGELKYKGETVTHWRPLPPPPGKEEGK